MISRLARGIALFAVAAVLIPATSLAVPKICASDPFAYYSANPNAEAISDLEEFPLDRGYPNGPAGWVSEDGSGHIHDAICAESLAEWTTPGSPCGTPGACDVPQPINPATGQMYHDEVDLYVEAGLLPLMVTRRYSVGPAKDMPFRKAANWIWPDLAADQGGMPVLSYGPLGSLIRTECTLIEPPPEFPPDYHCSCRSTFESLGVGVLGRGCSCEDLFEPECWSFPGGEEAYEGMLDTLEGVSTRLLRPINVAGEGLGFGWGEFSETTLHLPGSLFWFEPNVEDQSNDRQMMGEVTLALRQTASGYAGRGGWKMFRLHGSKNRGYPVPSPLGHEGEYWFEGDPFLGFQLDGNGVVWGGPVTRENDFFDSGFDPDEFEYWHNRYNGPAGGSGFTFDSGEGIRYRFGSSGRLASVELLDPVNESVIEAIDYSGGETDSNGVTSPKVARYRGAGGAPDETRPYLVYGYGQLEGGIPILESVYLMAADGTVMAMIEYVVGPHFPEPQIPDWDPNGWRLGQIIRHERVGGALIPVSRTTYEYGAGGSLYSRIEEALDSGGQSVEMGSRIGWDYTFLDGEEIPEVGPGLFGFNLTLNRPSFNYTASYELDAASGERRRFEIDPLGEGETSSGAKYRVVRVSMEDGAQTEERIYDAKFQRLYAKYVWREFAAGVGYKGEGTFFFHADENSEDETPGEGDGDAQAGQIDEIIRVIDPEQPGETPQVLVQQFQYRHGADTHPFVSRRESFALEGEAADLLQHFKSGSQFLPIDTIIGGALEPGVVIPLPESKERRWTWTRTEAEPPTSDMTQPQRVQAWKDYVTNPYLAWPPRASEVDRVSPEVRTIVPTGSGNRTLTKTKLLAADLMQPHGVPAWFSLPPGCPDGGEGRINRIEEYSGDDKLESMLDIVYSSRRDPTPDAFLLRQFAGPDAPTSYTLTVAEIEHDERFAAPRQVVIKDSDGAELYRSHRTTYDELGRVVSVLPDPLEQLPGVATTLEYDGLERLAEIASMIQGLGPSNQAATQVISSGLGRPWEVVTDYPTLPESRTTFHYNYFGYLRETVDYLLSPTGQAAGSLSVETDMTTYGETSGWGVNGTPYEEAVFDEDRYDRLVRIVKDREQLASQDGLPALDTVVEPDAFGMATAARLRNGVEVDLDSLPVAYTGAPSELPSNLGMYRALQSDVLLDNGAGGTELFRTILELTENNDLLPRVLVSPVARVVNHFYHDDPRKLTSGDIAKWLQIHALPEDYDSPVTAPEAEETWLTGGWAGPNGEKVGTVAWEYDEFGRVRHEFYRQGDPALVGALPPLVDFGNLLFYKTWEYEPLSGRVASLTISPNWLDPDGAGPLEPFGGLFRQVRYTYDARGRVTQREHYAQSVVNIDGDGNVLWEDDPILREIIAYDGADRPVSVGYYGWDHCEDEPALWRSYDYVYRDDGLLGSVTQWGAPYVGWVTGQGAAYPRAEVLQFHTPVAGAEDAYRTGVHRTFTYDSFGRLTREVRTHVVDEGAPNANPLAAEKRIERRWDYTYSIAGNLSGYTEHAPWPTAGWTIPETQRPAYATTLSTTGTKFDQIVNAAWGYDLMGAATSARVASLGFSHGLGQEFTGAQWDRTQSDAYADKRLRHHDAMGRLIAEEARDVSATHPLGNAVNRTLYLRDGWNLAAELDSNLSTGKPGVLWRFYDEGGLDTVFGAARGSGWGTEDYLVITDHLGSASLLMRLGTRTISLQDCGEEPPLPMGFAAQGEGAQGFGGPQYVTVWDLFPAESFDYDPYGLPSVYTPEVPSAPTASPGRLVMAGKGLDRAGTMATTRVLEWRRAAHPSGTQTTAEKSCQSLLGWRLLFTGREWDPASGAYNYRLRWYSPREGRFLSRDPIGYDGGLNQYMYCGGNPVNFVDPMGLWRSPRELANDFDAWVARTKSRLYSGRRGNILRLADMINPAPDMFDSVAVYGDVLRLGSENFKMVWDVYYIGLECFDWFEWQLNSLKDLGRSWTVVSTLIGFKLVPKGGGGGGPGGPLPKVNCFAAGTLVHTPQGAVPIESLKVGDEVLAFNTDTGEVESRRVKRTFRHDDAPVLTVTVGGESFTVTPDHPFWVPESGWTAVGELAASADAFTTCGDRLDVTVTDDGLRSSVFNIEVEGLQNYLIGEQGIVVHNRSKVAPYEVGPYENLVKRSQLGDGLDIHHVGQSHAYQQVVPGYNPATGPAIAVPKELHPKLYKRKGVVNESARQVLGRDLRELRRHTDAPSSAIRELIRLNRESYPGAFAK